MSPLRQALSYLPPSLYSVIYLIDGKSILFKFFTFSPQFLNRSKIHIKFAVLTTLKCTVQCIQYIHTVVLPSPPSSSRTLLGQRWMSQDHLAHPLSLYLGKLMMPRGKGTCQETLPVRIKVRIRMSGSLCSVSPSMWPSQASPRMPHTQSHRIDI